MPGDIGQYPLQDIGEITVIAVLLARRANMRSTVSDMNNDITVAARSMGDSPHQHRLLDILQFFYGSHSIMNEQDRRRHR